MKYIYILICSILIYQNAVGQTPQFLSLNKFTYQTSLSDEFNGTNLSIGDGIANGKWNDRDFANAIFGDTYCTFDFTPTDNSGLPNHNYNISTITDGSGGKSLKLINRVESTPLYNLKAQDVWNTTVPPLYIPTAIDKTGKYISTNQYYRYGYFEINAILPSQVTCSAQQFWLWMSYCSATGAPPKPSWVDYRYSEIDVFEIDNSTYTLYQASAHSGYNGVCGSGTHTFDYNNDLTTNPHPIITGLNGNWHRYGVNWQPNYIDYYIDGNLVQHLTDLTLHSNLSTPPYPPSVSVNQLQPMKVVLSTIFTHPAGTSAPFPPTGQDQVFEVDYFRYYKMNPVISYSLSGNNLTLTGKEGIDAEDYTWTVNSTPASGATQYTDKSVLGLTLGQGVTTVTVNAATGSTVVDVQHNPLTNASSTVKIFNNTNLTCWDICSTDISPTIDQYYARCIYSPGVSCGSQSVIITGNRNISYTAPDGIILNAGFQVDAGSAFSATNQ